ncbi:MAG: S8 family serine peptidase, partial [Oscillospiraceae bacterium]|nr:S8 family serine peptidase [Oscillospiraceae bacterium]
MKGNLKRFLAALLALTLVFSFVPPIVQADAATTASGHRGPIGLTIQSGNTAENMSFAETAEEETEDEAPAASEDTGLTKFEPTEQERFSEKAEEILHDADDLVTFIVVTEQKPQLELFSVSEIAAQTASVQKHLSKQEKALNAVQAAVKSSFGKEEGFEMGYTYTVGTTGFAVTTAFGNKAELEAIKGVKTVYEAPVFSVPAEQDAEIMTNNATTMIGADIVNGTGYTGKGMRIAILDTGLLVDHPNFAALSEDKLEDPMTRESVEAVWSTLNAAQRTNKLNTSYYNSKLPFVFNYDNGTFDVDNTYADHDHGTHVAGIAAANKIDGSNVVGVAPDAQVVVMQVFQSGGGASWATIMAALEDCVRLEVDAANLSLGSAAGFTDPDDEMLDTLSLFLDTDIQVLIASGNDTNNAYQNAWGLDMSLITDPDNGLTGTPATYSAALTVASVDNDGYDLMYFTVDGKDMGFQDTAATTATAFINNFRNQSLEYVVVPGVGEAADYEGLDVEGKIALVSRGDISFPEKQQIAQSKGAVGVVVYNNSIGLFLMQINDGTGNIPCVSIDMASGQYMIEAAGEDGVGSMTVCNADSKLFNVDRTVSSFSSRGVTPDLKLKPEISGVGGDIYATRHPAIAGSYYGPMSGTSMATPQITGAMAVLIQYLDENYPEITGSAQRKLAANLLMSTSEPLMATSELEYSPRAQGAGLANLINATTSPAYLSNADASESRPKIEFGDDDSKSGVYTFTFEVNNLTDKAVAYTFDSSVLTEAIYENYFIANSPYGLEAKVQTPDQVTVPANGSVTVSATLTLTENDKAYLDQFPNGIYVEGYLYANPVIEGDEGVQGVTLTMPMVGFYGDWSDAPVFDDPVNYSLYPTVIYTYDSQLGYNPYFRNGKSGEQYNAVSYANPIDEIDFGMMRNAKRLDIKVTDKNTGEVYHHMDGSYMTKTYFDSNYGMIIPTTILSYYGETWDGKTESGKTLPSGTAVTYSFEAWLDDGDDVMDDSWSFDMVLDNVAPELLNEDDLQASLRMDTESGRSYLTLTMEDNHYIAALIFMAPNGAIMGKYEIDAAPGETFTGEYEITGFGSEFTILVADYACNETEVEVLLDLGDQNNAVPEAAPLSSDRIYGSETFDSAIVEAGWFSVAKDYSDIRNETYDSSNRYYAAEYVNGYIIGQSVNTGNLELITPTGSYWGSQTLATNAGREGDPNVWLFYDMALDHSGTLAEKMGLWLDTKDSLWAVGWMYGGDQDNDGKDDGYNALFNIAFSSSGYVNVNPVARISGLVNEDLLTLGITTEGKMYGIGTNGVLYAVSETRNWDDNAGQYGDYVVTLEEIGETSFVNYPKYGGTNVIQSMGYDHNTGTMYWFAHSQVPVSYYYENVNVTYTVDLETGECTEVGTFGPGGQTSLFVPNDLQSDLFTLGVEATGMSIDPYSMTMVDGQTARMKIKWTPWNATPADVTWSSSDESIATVDEYGFVTAHAAGTVTITATANLYHDVYWDYDDNWNWVQFPAGYDDVNTTATVNVLASEDALYGYVIEDFGNADNSFSWITYSDKDLHDVTVVGKQYLEGTEALWYGGTYYNGYVWTTLGASWIEDDVIYTGTQLYKSKVTTGETSADLTVGEPELVG